MKKRILCLFLAALVTIMPVTASDVDGHWAQEGISFVTARELFSGVGDGRFAPDDTMTRAMLVTVVSRMSGAQLTEVSETGFTDVPVDAWYAPAVVWAKDAHLVDGIGSGCFAPNAAVTRVEFAAILYRYLQDSGYPMSEVNASFESYTDAGDVPDWGRESMLWAISEGIITGKPGNRLDAASSATRAEVATMIMRFYTSILKK